MISHSINLQSNWKLKRHNQEQTFSPAHPLINAFGCSRLWMMMCWKWYPLLIIRFIVLITWLLTTADLLLVSHDRPANIDGSTFSIADLFLQWLHRRILPIRSRSFRLYTNLSTSIWVISLRVNRRFQTNQLMFSCSWSTSGSWWFATLRQSFKL